MKMLIFVCLLFMPWISTFAQQDPLYAQYMLNPLLINPAYAGLNNQLCLNAGFRTQWTGLEGSPQTFNASAHSSFVANKVGVGIIISNDKIGSVTNTEINASFSYKLELDEKALSFGMQAGFQNFKTDYASLNIYDPSDPAFMGGERGTQLNIGAGLIFRSDKLFLGLSVPRLLPSTFSNGGEDFQLYNQHYYLAASYIHYFNENIRLKPSALFRGVKGAPASIDLAMNVNINARHTAGLFTRNFSTYGLQLQTILKEHLRLAYVFEVPTKNSVGQRFSSHEIGLMFTLPVLDAHDRSMFSSF